MSAAYGPRKTKRKRTTHSVDAPDISATILLHRPISSFACVLWENRAMPEYLRNFVPGGTFFFTLAVHQRRKILTEPAGIDCLREAMRIVKNQHHPGTSKSLAGACPFSFLRSSAARWRW